MTEFRRFACATAALAATVLGVPAAAQDEGAGQVLRTMSDYMAAQNSLSAKFDVALEVVTPSIEKIQFDGSGDLSVSRPDKLRMRRTGGYTDIELTYDGRTATIADLAGNAYGSVGFPGGIDALIENLRTQYFIEMPAADLLLTDSYEALMEDVVEQKQIGIGVVNGIECHHLAFRGFDTDWQIWIRTGDRPLPCKLVITSKTVAAAPAYTIQFYDWKTGARPAGDFTFKPASGAEAIAFADLANIGELPAPAPFSDGDAR